MPLAPTLPQIVSRLFTGHPVPTRSLTAPSATTAAWLQARGGQNSFCEVLPSAGPQRAGERALLLQPPGGCLGGRTPQTAGLRGRGMRPLH